MIDSLPASNSALAGPAKSAAPQTVQAPGGTLGKDEFLELFIAQLKNQDPLNPMDGQEFAAQLAQFSSVEQLTNINEQLTDQASLDQMIALGISTANAIGAIGRTVTASGDQLLIGPDGATSVTVDIAGRGSSATLRIIDEDGKTVGTRDLGSVSPGRQSFAIGDAADGLAPGVYHYTVDVTDDAGNPIEVQQYTIARIDGIASSADGPILRAGPLRIPLISVVEIAGD